MGEVKNAYNTKYNPTDLSLISSKLTISDIKNVIEDSVQKRPIEFVRYSIGSNFNMETKNDETFYFNYNSFFNALPPIVPVYQFYYNLYPRTLVIDDRILFYSQSKAVNNGIWSVISIIDGIVTIKRPIEYSKNTRIRTNQHIISFEDKPYFSRIYKNITIEYINQNDKIINYNGLSPQQFEYIGRIFII